jgi:hypothetical protein
MPSCGSGAGLGDSEKRTRIFGFHLAGEVTSPFTTETGAIALGQTLPLAAEKACFRRPKNLRFRTGHVGRCPRKGGNAMFRTLSLSLLLASSVSLANAQQQVPVDDGGVSGTLTSFEEETTGPPVDIIQVPAGAVCALTAACLFGSSPELSSTQPVEFLIAQGAGCVNYSPGLQISEGEILQCAGPGSCVVTGVLVELTGTSDDKP